MVDESSVNDVVPFERVEEEEDMFTRPYSDHQEGKDIDINYRSILGMRIEKAEVLWADPLLCQMCRVTNLTMLSYRSFWQFLESQAKYRRLG